MTWWLASLILALLLCGVAILWWRARRALVESARREAELEARVAQATRRRHELLANMSHDLRTPLASMQGYLELLLLRQGSLEPAEERNYLHTAVRQCEYLARLVAGLFDLTRLEAGDVRLQPESFNAAELAQDLVHKFEAEARRRGVQLAAEGLDRAPSVHADMALIAQLLDQLLDNALRHTPAGGAVTVRLDPRQERVALIVCDTGSGISLEQLPGVFERYDRAARVGDAQAGGHVGLGLAIARRIARLHGSELVVASQPREGTQVSFDLPIAASQRLAA